MNDHRIRRRQSERPTEARQQGADSTNETKPATGAPPQKTTGKANAPSNQESFAGSTARPPAAAAKPRARVDGVDLSDAEVQRLASARIDARVAQVIAALGSRRLGLSRDEREDPTAFQRRVVAAVERAGLRDALASVLLETRRQVEDDALYELAAARAMEAELRRRGVSVPEASDDPMPALVEAFRRSIAAELGLQPGAREVAAKVDLWAEQTVAAALWEPHRPVLDRALAPFDAEEQAVLLRWLSSLYEPAHGLRAAEVIAGELEHRGPAARLAALVEHTRRLDFTLRDFDELAKTNATLAITNVAEDIVDPIERAVTPVEVAVVDGKLALQAVQAPEFLEGLRAGRHRLVAEAGPDGTRLALKAADGAPVPTSPAVDLLLQAFERAASDVAGRIDPLRPVPIETLARRAGLGEWVDAQGTSWIAGSQAATDALQRVAVLEGLRSKASSKNLEETLSALGVSGRERDALLETAQATRTLQALQALPSAFAEVLEGKRTLSIPLAVDAPLDAERAAVVAAFQRYLVAAGALRAPAAPGALDEATVALLRQHAPSDDAATLDIDAITASDMLGLLKPMLRTREVSVAERLLTHPAVLAAREKEPSLHPVDVGLAYLRATGASLGRGPGVDDTELTRALEQSAVRPVSTEALTKAIREARATPLAETERAGLLAARATVVGEGHTRAYAALPRLGPDEAAALARRLSVHAIPSAVRTVDRGEWSSLVDTEPIAALKLALASIEGRAPPVDGAGNLLSTLTADDLARLRPMLNGPARPEGAVRDARWDRVEAAVRDGRVVIATLDPLSSTSPLAQDVNAVLETLRQAALALKAVVYPTDDSLAASSLQKAPYRPISDMADPLDAARRVLASAGRSPEPQGTALTAEDFLALDAYARDLERRTPTEKGSNLEADARAFLARWRKAAPVLKEVAEAVALGRLTIESGRVRAWQDDGLLEAKGAAALRVLMQAAEQRQTEARQKNEGFVGGTKRAAVEVRHHLFRLPGLPEISAINTVNAWSLVALRAEQAAAAGSAPPVISEALRKAQRHLDAPTLEAFIAQRGGSEHLPLLAKLRTGEVAPFDPRASGPGDDDSAEVKKLKAAVSQSIAASVAQEGAALQSVDASLIRFLVAKHPDAIGASVAGAASTGIVERPLKVEGSSQKGAPADGKSRETEVIEATALLERAAKRLEGGTGWPTLSVTLADDDETRQAKLLVQGALTSLYGKSSLWPSMVPAREAAAVEQLATRLAGMDPNQLAPTLKGALTLQGLASPEDLGAVTDATFPPAALEACAALAETLARASRAESPATADQLEASVPLLREAAGRGRHTLGSPTSVDPVDKALRRIAEASVFASASSGELQGIDLHTELPALGALHVRRPLENLVRSDPPAVGLLDVADKAGRGARASDVSRARLEKWKEHATFDPTHAAATALATYVQFVHLMPTMVGYDLSFAPMRRTVDQLNLALHSNTPEEREAAFRRIGTTWSEWANLQAMMTAYMTGIGFFQESFHLATQGKLDESLGKSVVFATMLGGSVAFARGVSRRLSDLKNRNERLSVAAAPARSLAVPYTETTVSPTPSQGRRVAASAYDWTVRGLKTVRDPRHVLLHGPAHAAVEGARALGDALGLERTIRFEGATPSFSHTLSMADVAWVSANPEGRLHFVLEGKRGYETHSFRCRDLMELGQMADETARRDFVEKKLGLKGPRKKADAKALYEMARVLPKPPPEASAVPSLASLVDPERVRNERVWKVVDPSNPGTDGVAQLLRLDSAPLLELLEEQRRGRKAFAKALAKHGLSSVERQVSIVLANYEAEKLKNVQSAARRARVLSGGARPAGANAGRRRLEPGAPATAQATAQGAPASVAPVTASAGRVPSEVGPETASPPASQATSAAPPQVVPATTQQTPSTVTAGTSAGTPTEVEGDAAARSGPTPAEMFKAYEEAITEAQRLLESTAARYGASDPSVVMKLAALEEGLAEWKVRLAAGALEGADAEAFRSWCAGAKSTLATELTAAKLDTVKGRAVLSVLEARLWAAELTQTLRASGVPSASVEIVKGVARGVGGVAKDPGLYAIVAMGVPRLVYDLGTLYGDPTSRLTSAEKDIAAAAAAARLLAEGVTAVGAFKVLGRLFPSLVEKLGPALVRGTVVGTVLEAPALVDAGVSAVQGNLALSKAVPVMAALGIPELSFLKFDEQRYPGRFFAWGSDVTNDRRFLEAEANDLQTPRARYVGIRGLHDMGNDAAAIPPPFKATSLAERLAQLRAEDPSKASGSDAPFMVRRPQDLRLSAVKSFKEPLFPTWRFLRDFGAVAKDVPELGATRAGAGFDFEGWRASVKSHREAAVTDVRDADGNLTFHVDKEGILALFEENDAYGSVLAGSQSTAIEVRRYSSVDAVVRWVGILNALGIPEDEKRAALDQFLENMAANHRANAILFDALEKSPALVSRSRVSREDCPDDVFTEVDLFLER